MEYAYQNTMPVEQECLPKPLHQSHLRLVVDQDTRLLREIAKQSTSALARFQQRFQQIILAFARKRLSNEQDCGEILNDVLLTVWQSAEQFSGRSSVQTWVLGITRHKILDYLRRRQRLQRLQHSWEQELEFNFSGNPLEQVIIAQDTTHQIELCLQQLPPIHRQVLQLAHYEDMSCSEMARATGLPLGTIKSRLRYAQQKMKTLMEATVLQ